jgi:hypothetical protein
VKEVREYASTRVRAREKLVDPVWFDNQGWEKWEFKRHGSFPGQVPFQGKYGYSST